MGFLSGSGCVLMHFILTGGKIFYIAFCMDACESALLTNFTARQYILRVWDAECK